MTGGTGGTLCGRTLSGRTLWRGSWSLGTVILSGLDEGLGLAAYRLDAAASLALRKLGFSKWFLALG
jgi:hypothetical protein